MLSNRGRFRPRPSTPAATSEASEAETEATTAKPLAFFNKRPGTVSVQHRIVTI
jgi:hypothetical protein